MSAAASSGRFQSYERRLREAGEQIQQSSLALSAQLRRAETLHRHLIWKVAGITLGSLVLMLAGGAWLSSQYHDEISKNQISAALLKAYNEADVSCATDTCVSGRTSLPSLPGSTLRVKPR